MRNSYPEKLPIKKLWIYLHLVPVFGVLLSLWSLYGKTALAVEELERPAEDGPAEAAIVKKASRLSVTLGLVCVGAIASLNAGAYTQTSQLAQLRFLFASSFVGSGYFLLSLVLMFRVAKDQSIQLPGLSQLSRRLPQ
ncbi:MAG: hypothetical protein AAF716_22245 [Cyanobacteria bacterium P01_D01_bin.1]